MFKPTDLASNNLLTKYSGLPCSKNSLPYCNPFFNQEFRYISNLLYCIVYIYPNIYTLYQQNTQISIKNFADFQKKKLILLEIHYYSINWYWNQKTMAITININIFTRIFFSNPYTSYYGILYRHLLFNLISIKMC